MEEDWKSLPIKYYQGYPQVVRYFRFKLKIFLNATYYWFYHLILRVFDKIYDLIWWFQASNPYQLRQIFCIIISFWKSYKELITLWFKQCGLIFEDSKCEFLIGRALIKKKNVYVAIHLIIWPCSKNTLIIKLNIGHIGNNSL